MNEQSRRVLNLDSDPHARCSCALLVAPMCDPGPATSPLRPTILSRHGIPDKRTTKEWWKTFKWGGPPWTSGCAERSFSTLIQKC
jgi:hypothetical protein